MPKFHQLQRKQTDSQQSTFKMSITGTKHEHKNARAIGQLHHHSESVPSRTTHAVNGYLRMLT